MIPQFLPFVESKRKRLTLIQSQSLFQWESLRDTAIFGLVVLLTTLLLLKIKYMIQAFSFYWLTAAFFFRCCGISDMLLTETTLSVFFAGGVQ